MEAGFFIKGLIIGFSIAAPVGPIGVLCIRRTLMEGRIAGFVSGLGAATADAAYGFVAGFGLTFISGLLIGHQMWLRLIGGGFLCYLGARIILSQPAEKPAATGGNGLMGAYTSTLFLTLTNPMTILSFAAIFAGVGVGSGSYIAPVVLVLGVFIGSALWWLLLSGAVGLFRTKIDSRGLRLVNRVSGAVVAGFGLIVLISLVPWK